MAQQHIHCSVNNCHYWSQGNNCSANEIIVVDDSFGAQQPDRVDHNMAKQIAPTPVENCMETCCKKVPQILMSITLIEYNKKHKAFDHLLIKGFFTNVIKIFACVFHLKHHIGSSLLLFVGR